MYPESRNRLPIPKREDFSGDERKLFDEMMGHQTGGSEFRHQSTSPAAHVQPDLARGLEGAG